MVTVVQGQTEQTGMLSNIFSGLPDLTYFVIIGLFIILGIILYLWWKNKEELEKSKEDNIYYDYLSTLRSCKRMARKDYINKRFAWKFLLFPPLFFLGWIFPVDKSVPIKDLNNKLLGRYRGEGNRNDGTINIMLSTGKKLLIFDNIIIIKLLRGFYDHKDEYQDMKSFIRYMPSKENCKYIQIACIDIEEYSYFHIPHIVDENNATIPMRGRMAMMFQDINNDINIIKFMEESNKQISKAFKSNSDLGYKQREPQEKKELIEV